MMDPQAAAMLDNPVWSALTGANRALGEGGSLARRYIPDVSPFAGIAEPTAEAFAALAPLVPPEGRIAVTSTRPMPAPSGLVIDMQAPIVQMVLERPAADVPPDPDHITLGATDVPDMLDLTARTKPGPFGPRTIEFGHYIGLRSGGTLAVMAGERMRFGRFVEISAVCVDPAFRGKGYAGLLMMRLARRIQAQGGTPFLHVFASNAVAITLYERLGFTRRAELHVTTLRLPEGDACTPTSGA